MAFLRISVVVIPPNRSAACSSPRWQKAMPAATGSALASQIGVPQDGPEGGVPVPGTAGPVGRSTAPRRGRARGCWRRPATPPGCSDRPARDRRRRRSRASKCSGQSWIAVAGAQDPSSTMTTSRARHPRSNHEAIDRRGARVHREARVGITEWRRVVPDAERRAEVGAGEARRAPSGRRRRSASPPRFRRAPGRAPLPATRSTSTSSPKAGVPNPAGVARNPKRPVTSYRRRAIT